jgi:hypothetical protein
MGFGHNVAHRAVASAVISDSAPSPAIIAIETMCPALKVSLPFSSFSMRGKYSR